MRMRIFAVLVLSLAVAVSACSKSPDPGEVITLSYSIFFPATHEQCIAGMNWAKEIEKKTDGKTATAAANEFFKAMKPKELDDVKVLYLHAHGPGLLHTKKPVKKLEDLKGMKIRSTGLSAKVVSALGGVPVAMPQGATYESLQKGVVDGTFAPIETLKGWKQGEVIKHTTNSRTIGYTTGMYVIMNKAKWDKLPDAVKAVFTDVSDRWVKVHGETWDRVDGDGVAFTKNLGNGIIELDAAEGARWSAAVKPVIDGYIAEMKKKNLPGDKAIAELRRLIAQSGK